MSGVLCQHTITLDSEGLTEVSPVNEGRHYWRGMHLVDTTSDHIFIYTQPNQAHTIPRRAFASHDLAELFFRAVVDYHRAAVEPVSPRI